ncbi:MAG TPA: hypothetical protein VN259_14290 [Xanthomonadales bacterium]|nr:hypothetical protein [Xanthomonadales bacterium]
MSSQEKRAGRNPILQKLLGLLGVVGVLGATAPVEAHVDTGRQALETRVLAIRAAMHDAAEADPPLPPDQKLVQLPPRWPNWGNWNNWPNWGNWFNR